MELFNGLDKNGSGYTDSTAFHAIVHVTLDESRDEKKIKELKNQIYDVCNSNNVIINGKISVKINGKNKHYDVFLNNKYYKKDEKK